MKKTVILGAGVAGLACANKLNNDKVLILEKEKTIGGLCQSFEIDGFFFDYGAHAAFTKKSEVKELLEKDVIIENSLSEAMNYKKGCLIKQPVQNNLYILNTQEKVNIIRGFIQKKDDGEYLNYGDWLCKKYGKYFAENYPYLYTRKYWTVSPELMETKWIGNRMYTPTLEELLVGSYTEDTPNVHYAGEIRYPVSGGFGKFVSNLSLENSIRLGTDITKVNTTKKTIFTHKSKYKYEELVSTIPLPELIRLIDNVPEEVKRASENLNYTTLVLVSLGIRKSNVMHGNSKCLYVYDEDILPSRIYSTSQYGSGNAPDGCTSIQAEIYFSKFKSRNMSLEEILNKTIEDLICMKLFKHEDVIVKDIRVKEYANIIFTKDIYQNRKIVHDYLKKQGILYAGRFGEWDYLWSDQSILSGLKIAEKILEENS